MTGSYYYRRCSCNRSKRKVIGAHRAGIREVILPDDNRMDESDIPSEVAKIWLFTL